jgi:hypothetical protein
MSNLLGLFVLLLLAGATPAFADAGSVDPDSQILRVGGDYTVTAVDKQGEGAFHVEFRAVTPSGKFDLLTLESDHVHVAVKVGQKIRLSAEILTQKGAAAEVAQVVIFLPSAEGRVPVWLLSTKAEGRDLRASRYLEMHVPANDFMIM